MAAVVTSLALGLTARSAFASPSPSARARNRQVGSQAYYHALRADLCEANRDLGCASEQLHLARVYDPDSVYLTLNLARVSSTLERVPEATSLVERAIALDPDSSDAWLFKARMLAANGRAPAALKAYRRSLRTARDPLVPALELGDFLASSGRTDDAIRVFREVSSRVPESAAPLIELARIEVSRRRYATAAAIFEEALSRERRDVATLIELTSLYERFDRLDDAASRWRAMVELLPDHAEVLMQVVRAELRIDRDDSADDYAETLLAQVFDVDVRLRLGFTYLAEGRAERARELLSEVVEERPAESRARFGLAASFAGLGRDEAALAELEQVGPDDRVYLDARLRIAQLLLSLGRFDRAEASLKIALKVRPRSTPLLVQLAMIQERSGHLEDALATLREERALSPTEFDLVDAESSLLLRAGDRIGALRVLRAASDGDPTPDEEFQYRLAAFHQDSGEQKIAIEICRRIVRDYPASARALNFLGYAWAERGENLEQAEALIKRALAEEPRSGEILDSLGWVYFKQGRFEEARRFLERAHRVMALDPEIAEHLAEVRMAQGDRRAAESALHVAVDLAERAVRAKEPGAAESLLRVRRKLSGVSGSK